MITVLRKPVIILIIIWVTFMQTRVVFAKDTQQSKLINLKVNYLPYLSFAPFFIAEEEGFFIEQGLKVEFVKFSRSAQAVPALAQGKLDVLGGSISCSLLNAISRGAKIKIVADKSHIRDNSAECNSAYIMIRKDLDEEGKIFYPDQLKGKKIAYSTLTAPAYCLEKLLNSTGLEIGDIESVDITNPTAAKAFERGAIDLYFWAYEPWPTNILKSGHALKWMPVSKVIPDFQLGVILYGPNLLEKEPYLGKKFMVAYLKSVKQFLWGKTDRNMEILLKHTKLNKDILMEACWPSFREDGRLNTQSIIDMQNWANKHGFLDSIVEAKHFLDLSFLDYANEILKTD